MMLKKTDDLLPISGVKVTEAGRWGDLNLSVSDLEVMAAHWERCGRRRLPVTFEHDESRVIGFALNLRHEGKYLVADLLLSHAAYRAVEKCELMHVSIGWRWSGFDRQYVVTSVGLAGPDTPSACRFLPKIQIALDDMRLTGMRVAHYGKDHHA